MTDNAMQNTDKEIWREREGDYKYSVKKDVL